MPSPSIARNAAYLAYSDSTGEHAFALEQESISVGRGSDQDLLLPEPFVSRRHAVISQTNGGFELIDQNSSHGTFLNGVRTSKAVLKSGDIVQFGSIHAPKFRFEETSENSRTRIFNSLADDLLFALQSLPPGKEARAGAREMEQLSFLIAAARELNAGTAIADILRVLLQSSIKITGVERGFVFLREGGEMRLALGLTADGTPVAEDSAVSRRAMHKAIENESKFYISDTLSDESAAGWASVVAHSIRSIYCIPLRKHISPAEPNRLLGVLYLDSQIGVGRLSEIDDQVLDTVATEAANLLHNALLAEAETQARRAAEELAIAAQIHASLMAITLPEVSYAAVHAKSIPCLAIGGDFYDALALPDCIGAVIADISGKGVPASIVAATLQGIIHAQMLSGQDLPEIASLVNRFLCARNVGKYATIVMVKLWPDRRLEYVNCGHVPPIVTGPKGIRTLEESNLIVGLIPGASYAASQCMLEPGDRVLLMTDGITEAENRKGEQFGDTHLNAALADASVEELLMQVAKFHSPGEPQDDWTLLEIAIR